MPWQAEKIVVTDQPTELSGGSFHGHASGLVKNVGGATVYLGADDVTVDEGFPLETGAAVSGTTVGEHIYAVVESGLSGELRILAVS
jgi:hypothetical protein